MTTVTRTDSQPLNPAALLGSYTGRWVSGSAISTSGVEVGGAGAQVVRLQVRKDYSLKARLKAHLEEFGLVPARIAVGEGGDVDAYFFGSASGRFVAIGVDSAFDMAVLFSDRQAGTSKAEDIEPQQLATIRQRVREFLRA